MGAMSNERIGREGSEREGRMVSIIIGLYFIIII